MRIPFSTVEARYDEVLGLTIHFLYPSHDCKINEKEPRHSE